MGFNTAFKELNVKVGKV